MTNYLLTEDNFCQIQMIAKTAHHRISPVIVKATQTVESNQNHSTEGHLTNSQDSITMLDISDNSKIEPSQRKIGNNRNTEIKGVMYHQIIQEGMRLERLKHGKFHCQIALKQHLSYKIHHKGWVKRKLHPQ